MNEVSCEAAKLPTARNLGTSRGRRIACIGRLFCVASASLSFLAAQTATATPVISEVFYDAVGSDDGQSFVEIYGSAGTLLDGLTLEGINGANGAISPIILLSGVIPVDGVFVVADVDGTGGTAVAGADQLANFDFQNGPDSIALMNGVLVIDAIGYGVFAPGEFFAGEGSAALEGPPGSSLARKFADLDTDDNSVDFIVLEAPTPGSVELLPVPEPGSGLLTTAGLIALGVWRRRGGVRDERARVATASRRCASLEA